MKQKDLPRRWQEKIQTHLKESGSKYDEFSAYDFTHNLKITFEDGSYAFFNGAFYWADEELEVCVFTEHCGLSRILLARNFT